MNSLFVGHQGSCKSCDALTLFAVCRSSCPPPEDMNKGRRQGKEGSSAYLRKHSLSPSHINTALLTMHWAGLSTAHMCTCSHKHINKNMHMTFFLNPISQIFLCGTRCTSLESRPTENHRGHKHKHTKNGRTLIKSQVNSVKYINWGWCFSVQNKADSWAC